MASFKKYRFPLLFGAILGGFATAFIYRQYFLPDVDEIRRQDYENFKEKLPELIAHRERVNEKRMQMIEAKKDQSS